MSSGIPGLEKFYRRLCRLMRSNCDKYYFKNNKAYRLSDEIVDQRSAASAAVVGKQMLSNPRRGRPLSSCPSSSHAGSENSSTIPGRHLA
ncbi:hypothetical protein REMIM1_PA00033 (plasmid) [Rhizobium etli bv. mimosae str. Mim1]|nr:hypothetical protein REMIM1_PA00033 [Rhizobium etli bv. mimosae str. Mim1]